MDLESALMKHGEWKQKFRAAMKANETLDAASISKDNCCDLGKWLHGEAKAKFSRLPAHGACLAKHAAFHVEAGKIAALINAKKFADAETQLTAGHPYMDASSAVSKAIQDLRKVVSEPPHA